MMSQDSGGVRADTPSPARPTDRRSMILVLIGAALGYLAVTMVIPVLPVYLHSTIGAGAGDIGLVMGAPALTAVAARPLAGLLSDLRGQRFAFTVGTLPLIAGAVLYPLCHSTLAFTADRLMLGIGQGAVMATATVWVVDLAAPERRGWALGLVGMVNYLVLGAGALLGAVVVAATGSYWSVWAVAAALPTVALVLGRIAASPPPRTVTTPGVRTAWWSGLSTIMSPGASLALSFFGYGALTGFVVVALDQRGIAHGTAVLTCYAVGVVLSRLLLGTLPDRLGMRPCLAIACAAEAAGLLTVAFAGNIVVAVAGGLLCGIGMSLIYPALGRRVVRDTEHLPRRQTIVAAFGSFVDIGVGVGGPVLGLVANVGGYPAAFVVAAVLVGVAFVIQAGWRSAARAAR